MATPSQLPDVIGRFRIEALLGRGGMGEVYKAVDPTLQRTVAVKTVRPDINRPEYLERLYREAQACARLHHPNIVTVYEAGEIDGVVYIAMEYLEGENLSDKLSRGDLSFEQKIGILVQVLSALEHAHSQDVVHRDIKPSNVHVQSDGSIKLVDFGLARMVRADTLTISGTIVGTPHYASPEQLRGEPIDGRTDVYSTGALAYEMLAGRLPFRGEEDESITTVILRVISQPPPPMQTAMSRSLPEIERIVSRAMAKSRDDRYQSAKDMRGDLLSFLASSSDTIRKVESQADQTFVLPRSEGATTLTTRPEPLTQMPSVASPSSAAPVAAAAPAPSRTMWWVGGAVAAIAIVAVAMMMRPATPSVATPAPVQAEVQPSAAAPAPSSPAPSSTPSNLIAPTKGAVSEATKVAGGPAMNAAAPVPAASANVAREIDAKELFSGTKTGLRYRLQQKLADGRLRDVDASTQFRNGDEVRFAFESNTDGFLYVIQQGSSGKWDVLFPNPDINGGKNAIRGSQEYMIPGDDFFTITGPPGVDQIYVLFSREPLAQLPGFSKPVTQAETVAASTVTEVQSTIKSRDLVFKKDTGTTAKGPVNANYVVNPTEVSKSVSASISLSHGQ